MKTNILRIYAARYQATRTELRAREDKIAGFPWPKALYIVVGGFRKGHWGREGFRFVWAPLPVPFCIVVYHCLHRLKNKLGKSRKIELCFPRVWKARWVLILYELTFLLWEEEKIGWVGLGVVYEIDVVLED